jgi:hypothetical protein
VAPPFFVLRFLVEAACAWTSCEALSPLSKTKQPAGICSQRLRHLSVRTRGNYPVRNNYTFEVASQRNPLVKLDIAATG